MRDKKRMSQSHGIRNLFGCWYLQAALFLKAFLQYFGFFRCKPLSPIDTGQGAEARRTIKDRKRGELFAVIEGMDLYELRALKNNDEARARLIKKIRLSQGEFDEWFEDHVAFKERERDLQPVEEARLFRRRLVASLGLGLVIYSLWPSEIGSERRSRDSNRLKNRLSNY